MWARECSAATSTTAQKNLIAVEDYKAFTQALRDGVSITRAITLTRHVLNAVARQLPLGECAV